ncbi:hypothetical protein Tco_0394023 [Tanacetum coccineum]
MEKPSIEIPTTSMINGKDGFHVQIVRNLVQLWESDHIWKWVWSMSVVYVLTTLIPDDGGDDATVEQIRKRAKWDNDDYVCRGLILKDQLWNNTMNFLISSTLKEELTLVELGSHLRIEESLVAQDSDKPKGNNIVGPQLGYVHFKRMQDMSKDGLIRAFDMDTKKCKTCMLNKITKKLFQNVKRKTEVLELIHSNLCDLHATPSLGNKKYFVTFIDDASRAVVRLPDLKLKTLSKRGIECIFVGYVEHSKAFRFYVIEPNDSVVPEEVTEEVVQQPEHALRKSKRIRTPKDFGPKFQLYLIEGTRDEVSDQHSYCFNVEDDPKTFDEAMKSQDVAFWKEAINDEMDYHLWATTLSMLVDPTSSLQKKKKKIKKRRKNENKVKWKWLKGNEGVSNKIEERGLVVANGSQKKLKKPSSVDLTRIYIHTRFSMKDMGEVDVIFGIRIKHETLTEAEQMKLATKQSLIQTHTSHASGSGAHEGIGVTPGVPDVPTYESDDEQISWKSSDEEDDDYDEANVGKDEDDDDHDDDDDDEQTESDNDDEDFVHPKFTIHDDEARQEEGEEESFDPRVQTSLHVESTDDENDDEEVQGLNIEGKEMDEEANNEEDEGNELYWDLNVNLEGQDVEMTDDQPTNVQTTQVTEDTHMIITPVILEDVLVTTIAEPPLMFATTLPLPPTILIIHMQQTPFPISTTAPSTSLQDLPNFGSLFGFDHRLKTLETDFSEFKQTNQFAEAISSILGIVDAYLANKMNEAVKIVVQLKSERLRDEAQAENEDFLNKLDDNIKKIIKDQLKSGSFCRTMENRMTD